MGSARRIAKSLARGGCRDVTARPIRKDLYAVDPETWDRRLIAANVLLSEISEVARWWGMEYRKFGLAVLPAERRPKLKVLKESKRVG